MSRFFSLQIADVRQETADAVSVSFNIPADHKAIFQFIQGQYITFRLNVNGEEIRRSYSICSGTEDGELRVAVKRVKGGKGSNFINDFFKPGITVETMPPAGNFYTDLHPDQQKNYVLFAGGSGITPMLSIIKTVLKKEPKSTLVLLYGNRDETSIIFKNELDNLANNFNTRLKVIHVLENPLPNMSDLQTGLMSREKNLALIENFVGLKSDNEYFICGPGPMMENAKQALESLHVDAKKIHIEYFSAPTETIERVDSSEEGVTSQATVILDGDEYNVSVKAGQNLLEALLDKNIDAPYACQGGSCCTCRALLVEGKVKMLVNYALLEDEVKDGYILTCQSIPLTDSIVVDYDRGK